MTASLAADRLPDPTSIAVTLQKIAGFADLEPGWDSYGGEPSSPVARAEAMRWVEIVADLFGARASDAARPFAVAPLADGGVQVEWRGPKGTVELEIAPAGEFGYLLVTDDPSTSPVEEVDDASWSDVLRTLRRALAA